jgi:peptidyl-prolyl cis-trans isomerase B (cyclophilin B)
VGVEVKKKLATGIGILFAVASVTFVPTAQAAPVKCTPTKAVGHTPKKIATPKKVLTKFPKKFTLVTNCGNIVISTVGSKAPFTMTSIAALAKGGYYDNSLCHRLTTQGLFVLQCGDPTATGSGGPEFTYPDENLPANKSNN